MSSPAYMLPNNRSDRDSGRTASSMMRRMKLMGASSHRPDAVSVERRGEPFLEEQPDALVLDADVLDEKEHPDRHADGRVHVRGRHGAQMLDPERVPDRRQRVDGEDVHEVVEDDQAENREGEGPDELAVAVEGILDQAVHPIEHDLGECLELARHAAGGAVRRDVDQHNEDQRDGEVENDAVEMQCPEAALEASSSPSDA